MLKLKCPVENSKEQMVRFEVGRKLLLLRRSCRSVVSIWGKGGSLVARALLNHNVWLTLGYVGIILLMARAYS